MITTKVPFKHFTHFPGRYFKAAASSREISICTTSAGSPLGREVHPQALKNL